MKPVFKIPLLLGSLLLALCSPLHAVETFGTISADGDTIIEWGRGDEGTLEVANDFGGGTVTIFYLVSDPADPNNSSAGNWVQFDINGDFTLDTSDEFTDDFGITFKTGAKYIKITVADATSPDMDFRAGPAR